MREAELVTVDDEVHACRLGAESRAGCKLKRREMDPVDADLHYVARDGLRSTAGPVVAGVGSVRAIRRRSARCAHHHVSATQPMSRPHMMIAPRVSLDCGAPDSGCMAILPGYGTRTPVWVNIPAYLVMACGR